MDRPTCIDARGVSPLKLVVFAMIWSSEMSLASAHAELRSDRGGVDAGEPGAGLATVARLDARARRSR